MQQFILVLFLLASTAHAESLAFTWPEPERSIEYPFVDIDKLCRGIALAETGSCTTGMAVTRKNCHGIMTWRSGTRAGRTFNSFDESQAACIDLWSRKYKTFPTYAQAETYTGSDDAGRWLSVVTTYYLSQ